MLGAGDVDLEHRRGEVALDVLLPQIVVIERDSLGGLAVAVDHGGYFSFTTGLACGPLAGTWARRGFELDRLLSHGFVSPTKKGPAKAHPPAAGLQGCRAVSRAMMHEMARVIAAPRA